jgi:hypothetical protein
MHKTGTEGAFPSGTTTEEKKKNLKEFLLSKMPNETTLIDEKIAEIADNIGYDEDDFMFGGRRKTSKRKTNKRKTNKRKTNRRKMTRNMI